MRSRPFALLLALGLLCASPALAQKAATPKTFGKYKVISATPALEVLSQGRTGTCWSYATVSFLETEVQRITGKKVDLSEMYVVRHAALEKARRYVMLQGKTQFSEGGLSHDLPYIIKRYGIVPQSSYTGLLGDAKRHDHSELFKLLEATIAPLAKSDAKPSSRWLKGVAGLIDGYLGRPPETVEVDGRTVSPKEYATEVLKLPVDDYVEVMSYGREPFYERHELLVPDNWLHYGGYLNLPIDEFMANMDHALSKGFSVAIDIDVSETGFRNRKGVASLGRKESEPPVTQEQRDAMFEDRRTTDDHLMHITGIVEDEDGKRYYLTKNSWGKRAGIEGYWVMTEKYVRAKALGFMVHKDALRQVER